MIKAFIFDFDGVIVESCDIKTAAFARLFEAEGADVVAKVIAYHQANGGMSRFEKFRYFYHEFLHRDLPTEEFDRLCHEFSRLVMEEVIIAPLVLGAVECLTVHHRKIPCFIASATPEEELIAIVTRRSLGGYFRGVFGAPRSKADIIGSILNDLSILPDEALFVGDALNDYYAARTCGVPFVGREVEGGDLFAGLSCPTINNLFALCELTRSDS